MTREELRDYVDRQRILNNIPYHVYSALIDGIDTLEQEPVLDKIRAEIEEKCCITVGRENDGAITLHDVFEIIDKYKEDT